MNIGDKILGPYGKARITAFTHDYVELEYINQYGSAENQSVDFTRLPIVDFHQQCKNLSTSDTSLEY